jgi:hypothetical protein
MLAKHNIKRVAIPHRKISNYLPQVKDAIGLKTPGIYKILYECGKVFIGQSDRPSTYALKNMTDILDWPIQANPQWQNSASTRTTPSDYRTPNFSPQKQHTVIGSSERPLK